MQVDPFSRLPFGQLPTAKWDDKVRLTYGRLKINPTIPYTKAASTVVPEPRPVS
jgi:hypothetical protein